uniref:Protein O-linked-mannose beta-1,2-N-acetylglucosaminyltransferase 1-like n=2 Tax=Hirondellea gigas TaxID=1518452 RepID=A0A6A7FYK8_9CRUS
MLSRQLLCLMALAAARGRVTTIDPFPDHWRKLADDRYLDPVNTSGLDELQAQEQEMLQVKVTVISENVQVFLGDEKVYSSSAEDSEGFHVLGLHPQSGMVLLRRQFRTGQLAEADLMSSCLASIQPHTIVLIIALFDAGEQLGRRDRMLLEMLGMEGHGVGGAVRLAYDFSHDNVKDYDVINTDEFLKKQRNITRSALRKHSMKNPDNFVRKNDNGGGHKTNNSKQFETNIQAEVNKEIPNKMLNNGTRHFLLWNGYLQSEDPSILISQVPSAWPPQHQHDNLKARVYAEAANVFKFPRRGIGDLTVQILVPKGKAQHCDWHNDSARAAQLQFCSKYEGYGALCRCDHPINPDTLKQSASTIAIKETIPVAMLTATKSQFFYRQMINLLTTAGAAQTPVLVLIDGYNRETAELARLFRLPVLIHEHEGASGTSTPLNAHFRFSIHAVFSKYRNVSKAVILEDDLLLSPDFLSFFQQTAWLLDADPSIYSVNSFALNSVPMGANDTGRLKRSEMFPQFGWMITRSWAKELLHLWVHNTEARIDWDWWLHTTPRRKGRHVLLPEVSRSYHSGSAGAHVTGWMQGMVFANMIYNTDPDARLRDLHLLQSDNYKSFILEELLSATRLPTTFNPCDLTTLPPNLPPRPVLMAVYQDSYNQVNLQSVARCLHAFPQHAQDHYKYVMQYTLTGVTPHVRFYVIGCPRSPYCKELKDLMVVSLTEAMVERMMVTDDTWRYQQAREKANTISYFNHSSLLY